MQKRRSHTKSRRGCDNCKRQHVKCDEQGPSCVNCDVRQVECTYPPPAAPTARKRRRAAVKKQLEQQPSPSTNSRSSDGAAGLEPAAALVKSPATPSPLCFSTGRDASRLLELELMSRWSSRTFAMFSLFPGDEGFLQTGVVRLALQEDNMMNMLLSLTAWDLSTTEPDLASRNRYGRAALEYLDQTSAGIRKQLQDVRKERIGLLYNCASGVAHAHFVMTADRLSPLQRLCGFYDMMLGAGNIVALDYNSFVAQMPQMQILLELAERAKDQGPPIERLDRETRAALGRLSRVAADECSRRGPGHEAEGQSAMFQAAISGLCDTFASESDEAVHNFCFFRYSVGGPDFVAILKALDPLALLIAMHLAALLDWASRNYPSAWWIGSTGRDLVAQIGDMLESTALVHAPGVRENMAWIRRRVLLPEKDSPEEVVVPWSGVAVLHPATDGDTTKKL